MVEHERMEEDIEETINQSKVVVTAGIGQMSLHNLRKHMVKTR